MLIIKSMHLINLHFHIYLQYCLEQLDVKLASCISKKLYCYTEQA